jgi:hypothetical protein
VKQSFGHLRLTRPSILPGWSGWLFLFLVGFTISAHASSSDLPPPFTLDLPIAANLATPSWLGHPETPAATFATLNLPILTPDPDASLLVTVYFQEKQDGFMRIIWKGTQDAQIIADNFYENIGMPNQRSLLIAPSTLLGDGTLTFQCGDSTLGIQRIKLEWLVSKSALVSPSVQDLLVTPSTGPTQSAEDLNGRANPTQPGAWDNQIVTVPLTDSALRIEQGVEFNVDLDKVPGSARLGFKEDGLPLGKHLVVWINQQRAGMITPAVPDLLDDGFLSDGTSTTSYVGWRDASFYVPVSLLKDGINAIQFSDEDDAELTVENAGATDAGTDTPLAIKALVLQMNYPATSATPAATTTSDTPTGAIQPLLTSGPISLLAPPESSSTSSDTTTNTP